MIRCLVRCWEQRRWLNAWQRRQNAHKRRRVTLPLNHSLRNQEEAAKHLTEKTERAWQKACNPPFNPYFARLGVWWGAECRGGGWMLDTESTQKKTCNSPFKPYFACLGEVRRAEEAAEHLTEETERAEQIMRDPPFKPYFVWLGVWWGAESRGGGWMLDRGDRTRTKEGA